MDEHFPNSWVVDSLYEIVHPVKTGVNEYSGTKLYYSTGSISETDLIPEGDFSFTDKPSRANREVQLDDVLQARMQSTDKAFLVSKGFEKALYSTGFIQLRPYGETIVSRYIYYFCKSDFFHSQKDKLASGTTQVAINDANAKKIIFPVAPLSEQKRIVAKLESLFTHLKEVKTRLDKIPQLLKDFRQAVLTKAVSGKLIESSDEWLEKPLSDIADTRLGKMLDKNKNTGSETLYLRNTNVRWFEFDLSDLSSMKVEENELKKFELLEGDLLVCEGGEPGRAAIWKGERNDLVFQKALHRVRLFDEVLPEILLYNLRVDTWNSKLNELFTGTTIKHLTGRNFAKYRIKIPSLDTQKKIVLKVEQLLSEIDKIEDKYDLLNSKIENLPQTILAKAFKGELVEQLPTDGDAKELLKEIEALKSEVKPKKRSKK